MSIQLSRQLLFLAKVATRLTALLGEVERGSVRAEWRLGRRRLRDGRQAEVRLVVSAPRRDGEPVARHGSAMDGPDDEG